MKEKSLSKESLKKAIEQINKLGKDKICFTNLDIYWFDEKNILFIK